MKNMPTPENYELNRPPRHVPPMLALRVMFGGFMNQFGWFFFGFGMIFFWIFGMQADLTGWRFWGDVRETSGVIESRESTNMSENDREVIQYRYSFQDDRGDVYFGDAYSTKARLGSGSKITVEYLPDDPETSRASGMRRKPFSGWVLFVVIFPFIGSVFMMIGMRHGRKGARMLKNGVMTTGTLIGKERTNTKINEQPVYKLTFEFQAENLQNYQVTARTHLPQHLEDEPQERILYAPWNPNEAVVFDDLPGAPLILDGELVIYGKGQLIRSILPLIVPGITIFGHGLYVMVAYL